jgi:beta-lactamase superfamily II metal-dependent hydrolase
LNLSISFPEFIPKCSNILNSAFSVKDVTLNILYQKYYEQSTSSENNYSVCTLLSQGDDHYLFTGDLEKSGENKLILR